QAVDVLEALVRRFLKTAEHDLLEVAGQIGPELAQGPNRVMYLGHERFHGRLARERRLTGEEEIGQAADAVDVGAGIDAVLAQRLFRRHVRGRTEDGSLDGESRIVSQPQALDQAEIEELG